MYEKIVVLCYTLNNEETIGKFCESYQWADKILIADGGSSDKTVSIAQSFRNVSVREIKGDLAAEFLADWGEELAPTWFIAGDVKHLPNSYLIKDARVILAISEWDHVLVWAESVKDFPSPWAWRPVPKNQEPQNGVFGKSYMLS